MRNIRILAASSIACVAATIAPAIAATYVTFRAPDDPGNGTYPAVINREGVVVGTYNGGGGGAFIRYPDGSFTEFGVQGASITFGDCINGQGVVAGSYRLNDGNDHGYVRMPNGSITTFDVPNVTSTTVSAINPQGVITGTANSSTLGIGFIRTPDGTITTFQVPGERDGTYPMSINGEGDVTGQYCCTTLNWGGFIRFANGKIRKFDPPDAYATHPERITHGDWIAGFYSDTEDNYHGFIREGKKIKEFNVYRSDDETDPIAMNRYGVITGSYYVGHVRGFLRYPGNGKFQTFDVPNSTSTSPSSINAKNQIAGSFYPSAGGNPIGFIRTP